MLNFFVNMPMWIILLLVAGFLAVVILAVRLFAPEWLYRRVSIVKAVSVK